MKGVRRIAWLVGQVPPAELAARMRLRLLEKLSVTWRPAPPKGLTTRPAFRALSLGDELRAALVEGGHSDGVIKAAEDILRGKFTLFAQYPFEAPAGKLDWRASFPSGPQWQGSYSFDLDIHGRDGRDVRFTWELSRHRHLATLAAAWFLTRQERFAKALTEHLREWIKTNPFLRGPNWASALEVAMRATAWAFIDDAASDALATTQIRRHFAETLFLHGAYLERFLSRGINPSNHIIGEAAGLFVLGGKLSGHDVGRRWRGLARRVLEDEIRRQTFPSGASREQSVAYHRFVAGLFGMCLAIGSDKAFSQAFKLRLQKMYGFLQAVARPDGGVPRLGDGDDAAAFPLLGCGGRTAEDDLALAAALFREGARRAPLRPGEPPELHLGDRKPTAEVLWLLGPGKRVEPQTPDSRAARSVSFEDAGLAVLKSGSGRLQIEFDRGSQGYTPVSSHGHADALSVTLWRDGERLIDPGTYRYNGAPEWRNAFRSTAYHNTVVIDGESQSEPASPFRWKTLADARGTGEHLGGVFDWAAGTLPAGHSRPWSHRREVVRVGDGLAIIIDRLEARGRHEAECFFHVGDARLAVKNHRADASYGDGAEMAIHAANRAVGFEAVPPGGKDGDNPENAWTSPSYGVKHPASSVRGRWGFRNRTSAAWILTFGGKDSVKPLSLAAGEGYAAEIKTGRMRYLFACRDDWGLISVEAFRFAGRWFLAEFSGKTFHRAWAGGATALDYEKTRIYVDLAGSNFVDIEPS